MGPWQTDLMQLDFFTKLTAVARRALARPRPATTVVLADDDPWQAHARTLLQAVGCDDLAARVMVRWNPRMRSTAGVAYPGKALIRLNPRLRDFGDAEIDRTLRHELAHLLAHHRAGRRRIAPHGKEWQAACEALGLPGEKRCHDLPFPRRTMRAGLQYRCIHCGLVIHRVRPLRRKSACLSCCKAHSRGQYDKRFRFVKIPSPAA